MNWFVRKDVSTLSVEDKKKKIEDGCDCCEHVEGDHSLATHIHYEMDSFGPVSGYAACKACHESQLEEVGKAEVVCDDCGETHQEKDTISWKWYDFYAAQGDEPVIVCSSCRSKEKHVNRVKRDAKEKHVDRVKRDAMEYEYEFGIGTYD